MYFFFLELKNKEIEILILNITPVFIFCPQAFKKKNSLLFVHSDKKLIIK